MASSRKPSRRKASAERPARSAPAPSVGALTELALDLRWSWNHSADQLWAQLEPELWARTHNPWVVLQTVSRAKVENFLHWLGLGSFVLGLVESFLYGVYAGLVYVPIHNFILRRCP
jgi:hypothetical protein